MRFSGFFAWGSFSVALGVAFGLDGWGSFLRDVIDHSVPADIATM